MTTGTTATPGQHPGQRQRRGSKLTGYRHFAGSSPAPGRELRSSCWHPLSAPAPQTELPSAGFPVTALIATDTREPTRHHPTRTNTRPQAGTMVYLNKIYGAPVPQREPLAGRENDMVRNSAGGMVFPVDDFTRQRNSGRGHSSRHGAAAARLAGIVIILRLEHRDNRTGMAYNAGAGRRHPGTAAQGKGRRNGDDRL